MEEAIKVLVQVAQLAQSKGLLSLEDAVVVLQAIKVVTPKEEEVLEE
jgi:flagellar motor component MotA